MLLYLSACAFHCGNVFLLILMNGSKVKFYSSHFGNYKCFISGGIPNCIDIPVICQYQVKEKQYIR